MGAIRPAWKNSPLIAVVAIGVVLSLVAYSAIRQHRSDQANAEFSAKASDYAHYIVDGFSQVIFAIESVGGLYSVTTSVTASQFAEFTAPLLDRFSTISALGWVPRVSQGDRTEFERMAQIDFPGFRVTEVGPDKDLVAAGPRPVYFPVFLIRPYLGNEAAHGFDLYSDPVRRAAIDSAIDSGRTTSTARIRLVQERGRQYSVLLITPVFERKDSSPGSRAIRGVASAVYRIGDGVERALAQLRPSGVDVWLFDYSAEPGRQFLYFHRAGRRADERSQTAPEPPLSGVHHRHDFRLGERQFGLLMAPADGQVEHDGSLLAWTALLAGLFFTALVAAYIALTLRRSNELLLGRKALEDQVKQRKHAEQQLRQANQELKALSREDPVMGISNRRYFDEYFDQEWKRAIRNKTPLSLLIGDIDHFKSFNDTFGHIAGDKCLRQIAEAIVETLERSGDLVARYGGEEIAVVLPSTSAAGAQTLAERIRALVASLSPADVNAKPVTISIGFGTVEPRSDSPMEDFIRAVDAALYRAKQQGRNRAISMQSVD